MFWHTMTYFVLLPHAQTYFTMTEKDYKQTGAANYSAGAVCPKETLTVKEAAAYLGLKANYLYKLTSQRQIPHYKYGGRIVLFDRAALEAWKSRRMQAVPTVAEAEAYAEAYCVANPLKH